jgi:hypothetical protein
MRHHDWQKRFWAEIQLQSGEDFEWGKRDCVLSAARLMDVISDEGYLKKLSDRFMWANLREAVELMRSGTLKSLVSSVMGDIEPTVSLTWGDVALVVDDDERESLAINDGAQFVGPAQKGFRNIPFRCVVGGWSTT